MTTLSRDLFLVLHFCNKVENPSEPVCPKEREEENLLLKKKKKKNKLLECSMLCFSCFIFYFPSLILKVNIMLTLDC